MAEFVTEADIDIICEVNSDQQEKEKIPAHSSILSNASPVFAAMLTHDMLEKTTKQIEVHVTKEEWTMFTTSSTRRPGGCRRCTRIPWMFCFLFSTSIS